MDSKILMQEKQYLQKVKDKINDDIEAYTKLIEEEAPKLELEKRNFSQDKGHLFSSASSNFDTLTDLDSEFNIINNKLIDLSHKQKEKQQLLKAVTNPYFARVDVEDVDNKQLYENYIGLKGIAKEDSGFYVIDWRAPIASMFYDNENMLCLNGVAKTIRYGLKNKRQYRIKNGELEYYFDSSVKIDDEMLQQMLGKSSDEKMRNIVSSIQMEQNKVIRFNEFNDVYVLGVAGSGKTSIAMHRIAYLLFKLNGKIASKDFMILSPNKVFSNYISNVLHELNEDNVPDKTFEELVLYEFGKNILIESKQESIERIITRQLTEDNSDVFDKQKFDFLQKLLSFLQQYFINNFKAHDIKIYKLVIHAQEITNLFNSKVKNATLASKLTSVFDDLLKKYFLTVASNAKVRESLQKIIKGELYKMAGLTNPFKIYQEFLLQHGYKFSTINKSIKNEDIYPILLIKFWVNGTYGYKYKHLVVDEVQDYSAVQLFLINWLFNCPKTMLGDTSQSINASVSKGVIDTAQQIVNLYKKLIKNEHEDITLDLITLNKSYRNGYEITKLANSIIDLKDVELIKRVGSKPQLVKVNSVQELQDVIINDYNNELKDKYKNVALITKSQVQAVKLYNLLKDKIDINIITSKSKKFKSGFNVLSVYQSKGLEFDAVIIYNVNENNYENDFDKHLLYIAVTRALSQVKLLYSKNASNCIKDYFNI